jgi:hypothetical protein
MSLPPTTVNQVFGWLRRVFSISLPTLPFSGVYRRLTALFELTIKGSLPAPTDPLPWDIPVASDWISPIPGVAASINQIRIRVEERPTYSPPNQ